MDIEAGDFLPNQASQTPKNLPETPGRSAASTTNAFTGNAHRFTKLSTQSLPLGTHLPESFRAAVQEQAQVRED